MNKEFVVTPWEVKGEIDYEKLMAEFGLKPTNALPAEFEKNHLFRRKIVFAHRDFEKVLSAYVGKKPFAMMTGLMPSGSIRGRGT